MSRSSDLAVPHRVMGLLCQSWMVKPTGGRTGPHRASDAFMQDACSKPTVVQDSLNQIMLIFAVTPDQVRQTAQDTSLFPVLCKTSG